MKTPVFETLDEFLAEPVLTHDGCQQMFILADAGMGKTSLLPMLKLGHLLSFWPKGYGCLLLKLGADTLERLDKHADQAHTVLLLDALDEDPTARGRIRERLLELLEHSQNFRHVLIACRTQFFPDTGLDPFGRPGQVSVGPFVCPMPFLSLFDERQVNEYLLKRFPDSLSHGFIPPDRVCEIISPGHRR